MHRVIRLSHRLKSSARPPVMPKGRLDDKTDTDLEAVKRMPASKKGKLFKEEAPIPKHPGGVNTETGERGGPGGLEPTRYGDWERKGRISDFWKTVQYLLFSSNKVSTFTFRRMAQQQVLLDKFGDLGLTVTMKDELFELMDICSQYNLSKYIYYSRKF